MNFDIVRLKMRLCTVETKGHSPAERYGSVQRERKSARKLVDNGTGFLQVHLAAAGPMNTGRIRNFEM